jgi:hypothetical protein
LCRRKGKKKSTVETADANDCLLYEKVEFFVEKNVTDLYFRSSRTKVNFPAGGATSINVFTTTPKLLINV